MTDEQINIKIAELCGWKGPFQQEWIPEYGRAAEPFYCFAGTDEDGDRYPLPNYAGDLNACHEFERTLTLEQQFDYVYELNDNALGLVPLSSPASYREGVLWLFLHTTARQRCEAFLRVHGQWEEQP